MANVRKLTTPTVLLLALTTALPMALTGNAAAAAPATPDAAVKAVADGLQKNDPTVLWDAMPASYQKDVNGLIKLFGENIDAATYNKSFALAARLSKLLTDKKEFFLNSQMLTNHPDKAKITKNWDGMAGFFNTIATSEFSKHENLKTLDMGSFLANTGKSLMTQAEALAELNPEDNEMAETKAKLAKMKATVVEKKDDGVVALKLETEGEEPKTVDFVQVEGKWIPKEMADSWKSGIDEAKANIAKMNDPNDQEGAQAKAGMMMMLGMAEVMIVPFEQATTQAEFDQAMQGLGAMFGAGIPKQQ